MHRRQLSNGGKAILTHEFFSDIREAGLLLIVLRESVSCRCMESLATGGSCRCIEGCAFVRCVEAGHLTVAQYQPG